MGTRKPQQEYAAVIDFITWPKPDHPGIAGVTQFSHGMIVHFTAPNDLSARRKLGRLTPRKPKNKGRWVSMLFKAICPPIVVSLKDMYQPAGVGQWRDPYGWGEQGD